MENAEKPQGGIPTAMDAISNEIDGLRDTIARLEEQLGSVLLSETPQSASSDEKGGSGSSLADSLRTSADRLAALRGSLNNICTRLDL